MSSSDQEDNNSENGSQNNKGPSLTQEVKVDDCIKILLATDNHIGYAENDPVRSRDSINTFREILELAVANDVDMLLLAGDLFHDNRPSRTSLFQTMAALREFTMGDRPVSLELISDAGIGIARNASWPGINYEDQNINVGLPVFSIHGNHDDPQGTGQEGALCALDLLAASGLVNYFGRLELPGNSLDDEEALGSGLSVKPVLLQKGTTKLALYGMGNIRDERFHYEMKNNRIKLFKPKEDPEDWFNILLVHQNRVAHGPNNYVSDTAFGDDVHLVVWGHEHDCIEKAGAVPVTGKPYYITQPGSSVATSLAAGEAIPKHVSLVKIQGKEFEMTPIRLRSVRPFVFDTVSLADEQEKSNDDKLLDSKVKVNKFLKKKVNELIDKANAEWDELHAGEDEEERLLPLIRLRVDYSGSPIEGGAGYEIGNPQRFGQDFIDRVANTRDIVQFHRRAQGTSRTKIKIDNPDGLENYLARDKDTTELSEKLQVSSLVNKYLEAQNLKVLPQKALNRAIEKFVDQGNKTALSDVLIKSLKEERFTIGEGDFQPSKEGPDHDDLEDHMKAAQEAAEARMEAEDKKKGKGKKKNQDDSSEEEEEAEAGRGEQTDDSMRGGTSVASSSTKSKKKTTTTSKKATTTSKKSGSSSRALFINKGSSSDESGSEVEAVEEDKSDSDSDVIIEPPKKKATTGKKIPVKAPTKATAPVKKAPAKKVTKITQAKSSSEEESDAPPVKKRSKK